MVKQKQENKKAYQVDCWRFSSPNKNTLVDLKESNQCYMGYQWSWPGPISADPQNYSSLQTFKWNKVPPLHNRKAPNSVALQRIWANSNKHFSIIFFIKNYVYIFLIILFLFRLLLMRHLIRRFWRGPPTLQNIKV